MRRKTSLLGGFTLAILWFIHGIYAGEPTINDDFDRMDGHGKSGAKVDVIEWEGHLELHVQPPGALHGLALKLDKRNKDKPVMVIGYRFQSAPQQQLVRRAILGISLSDPLYVYRETGTSGYDKFVISGTPLKGNQYVTFKLDPAPKSLYPEGHPLAESKTDPSNEPAPLAPRPENVPKEKHKSEKGVQRKNATTDAVDSESGAIKPFSW